MLDSPSGQTVLGLEGGHSTGNLKILGHLCDDPLGKISTKGGASQGPPRTLVPSVEISMPLGKPARTSFSES